MAALAELDADSALTEEYPDAEAAQKALRSLRARYYAVFPRDARLFHLFLDASGTTVVGERKPEAAE